MRSICKAAPITPPRVRRNMACRRAIGPITSPWKACAPTAIRYFGQSDVERGYADVGYRAEGNEVHLSMTGAADGLGVAGTTPLELAQQNPWAVFTTPQTTDTTAEMITLSDESHITPTLTFNGNAYFRNYAQAHVDGNISSYYHCSRRRRRSLQWRCRHRRSRPRSDTARRSADGRDRPQLDSYAEHRRDGTVDRHRQDLRP